MQYGDPARSLENSIILPTAPRIPGLTFRLYRGEADLEGIEAVRQGVRAADSDIWLPGPDPAGHDSPSNPLRDCLLAEVNGKLIGYTWLDWWTEADGTQLYLHLGWLLPEWRRKGIGRALLRWQEQRLRQIASTHRPSEQRMFGANANEQQPGHLALLLNEGYHAAFTVVQMSCHLPLQPIQPLPLPDGLELRPVQPEQHYAIYSANEEVFRASNLGYIERSYEEYLSDLKLPETDTRLWFVAWAGDQIAGLVINEIDECGGHTPWVAVQQPWRRRGLARTLMTHTLRGFQERGVRQAELSTIAENPSRSVHLYESVGYTIVKRWPRYRKQM
ncbi:GNAT family N-acetyltransferase [Ktedonosporobacter rubrisoli]|uniref:GNAT family N-acetyltransferase n=1 Tax=Ktedonosporobacter rubrisoli TaxID=2509675 RepID=A0A4P6JM60_KTERU|nr:GNAT family N-acetyltransferase [Ktedonosporobacter rubrisoli]QBD76092.1 GNAT family N-acetyltransferase [Ktedonosporobacter rubrisoli]